MQKINQAAMELPGNEIHIWYIHPDAPLNTELLKQYQLLLSPEETDRVKRYKFDHLQQRAVLTRALVRSSLSQYCDYSPEQWQFEIQPRGKPEISNPPLPLRFNISHSKDMIICAISLQNDIGVDVEKIQAKESLLPIANRYFSPTEVENLSLISDSKAQTNRFFDYWTLKESYIKAKGLGLSIPLNQFSFHIGSLPGQAINDQIRLSFDAQLKDCSEHWQSWLCHPNEQYCIALSIHSKQQKYHPPRFFETTPLVNFQESSLPLPTGSPC